MGVAAYLITRFGTNAVAWLLRQPEDAAVTVQELAGLYRSARQ